MLVPLPFVNLSRFLVLPPPIDAADLVWAPPRSLDRGIVTAAALRYIGNDSYIENIEITFDILPPE